MKSADKTTKATEQQYQVLARRFRPQQFDEVLGQENLVTTLVNSIKLGRVGHAYLFCGPRGVGKTTVARILAKALNCAKGPTENPCNACQNCREITEGNALDVLEIDGASNRGIDEIRNLRENVQYMAASSRNKIYIIDEVHMLTNEAFNALLKTLEEPPPHIKFFFATTDPQKLPATILSRCQKFELKRIPAGTMRERLAALAKKEKAQLSEDAALAIIQQAQGSMRDAESLLEVLISSGRTQITFADVRDILGLSDQEIFFAGIDAITQGDPKAVLHLVADLFAQGRDPARFLTGFTGHLRNLLLAKVLAEKSDVLEMPREQIKKIADQAGKIPEEHLVALLELSTRTEQQMRTASNTRILLELFFMKAVEFTQRPALTGLLARLEQLESRLKGGSNGTGAGASVPRPAASNAVPKSSPQASASQISLYDEAPPTDPAGTDPASLKNTWRQIAQALGATNPIIRTCMQEASPIALQNDELLVQLKKGANFQKATLEDKSCQNLIEQRLQERLGRSVKIRMHFSDGAASSPAGVSHAAESPVGVTVSVPDDPHLKDALSILKGKIIKTTKGEEIS